MAGIKISNLPAAPSSLLTDVVPADQGATTYKESLQQIMTLYQANIQITNINLNSGTGASASTFWRGDNTWATPPAPTGAALTKADDTNVTLTLGGTPSTALLQATSITAGWTGQLSVARGGTGLAALTAHYILIGNGTTALTLLAPNATSGIPLISQGASADPTYGTAVVAGGGTGNTTFTAFSVICAGTTATGPFQNVSGLGSSGNVLTSNGAGALPTWQAPATVTPAALTKTDDTNVTLTLSGTPTTALLQATGIAAGWAGQLSLARGGTAANLTASNGGIFYSTASAGAILAGTATAGLALLSGASTTPTWSSSPPITRVVVQTFTTTSTYTPTAGMKYCLVQAQGGGGGGGGCTSGSQQGGGGGGGGAGGYAQDVFTAATIGGSQAITINSGGTGGTAGNTGTTGGSVTFGALLTANGGIGGQAVNAVPIAGASNAPGGLGGTASGAAAINISGDAGQNGFAFGFTTTGVGFGANGASSRFGAGGLGGGMINGASAAGSAGLGNGSGGGGGTCGGGSGSAAGGAGKNGIVVVTEYISV